MPLRCDVRCDCESGGRGCASCGECASFLGIRFWDLRDLVWEFGRMNERTTSRWHFFLFPLLYVSSLYVSRFMVLRYWTLFASPPNHCHLQLHFHSIRALALALLTSPPEPSPRHQKMRIFFFFVFPLLFFIAFHNCCLSSSSMFPRAPLLLLLASFISKNVRFAFLCFFCAFVLL